MTQQTPTKTRPVPTRVAPDLIHEATPGLGWYTDNILFGEVWEDKALSKRDRSLVTITCLITRAYTGQLTGHFNRALNHGMTPTEIAEVITHLAFYAGWPPAMSAISVMQQVFASRNVGLDQVVQSTSADLPLGQATVAQRAGAAGVTLADYTRQVLEEDLWLRKELAPRDRSLVMIVTLVAQGQFDTLAARVEQGLAYGLLAQDLREALTHLAFYAGWPKASTALATVEAVFQKTA